MLTAISFRNNVIEDKTETKQVIKSEIDSDDIIQEEKQDIVEISQKEDSSNSVRASHENKAVLEVYKNLLNNDEKSIHKLLHIHGTK